jgi:hypothetical protein
MEQVLAPNFGFKTKIDNEDEDVKAGEIRIRGFKEPSSQKSSKTIASNRVNDLKVAHSRTTLCLKAMLKYHPEVINNKV